MPATIDDILSSPRTGRPIIMGILNVTPDSFSDGGQFLDAARAVEHAGQLAAEGADVIDIGAQSTRPGSQGVDPDQQIRRLREVVPAAAALGRLVSIDTTNAAVAEAALDWGAAIINDVSAGRADAGLLGLAGRRSVPIILMHMLGSPRDMQIDPRYIDVVAEVRAFLSERLEAAVRAGAARERVILDPGIGFGKTVEHNLALLAGTGELAALGQPVLVAPSRKRFLGVLTGQADPQRRVVGTVAACLAAYARGATIFRVHDVAPLAEALAVTRAIDAAEHRQG